MKKYLTYIMMLTKSTWKLFLIVIFIGIMWGAISFGNMMRTGLVTFESIVDYAGRIYMVLILAVLLLLYIYKREMIKNKTGMELPILWHHVLVSRIVYGTLWYLIITILIFISLYVEGFIYVRMMPNEFVTAQTTVMGLMNTDFGRFIYDKNCLTDVLHTVMFMSFMFFISIDKKIKEEMSGSKKIMLYVVSILFIIITSFYDLRVLNSSYISEYVILVPAIFLIMFLYNGFDYIETFQIKAVYEDGDDEKLKKYLPEGYNPRLEKKVMSYGVIIATGISIARFILSDSTSISRVFNHMFIFASIAIVELLFIFAHYRYYTEGSNTIYLAKRLPDKNYLLKKIVVTPLMRATMIILSGLVLIPIFFFIYEKMSF